LINENKLRTLFYGSGCNFMRLIRRRSGIAGASPRPVVFFSVLQPSAGGEKFLKVKGTWA
jgi:hypothetical protein